MPLDQLSELELANHWIASLEHHPRGRESYVSRQDVLRMCDVAGEPPHKVAAGLALGAKSSANIGVQSTMLVALAKAVKVKLTTPAAPPAAATPNPASGAPTPPAVPPTPPTQS